MSEEKHEHSRPRGPMHGPRRGGEKAKNFKKSIVKLAVSLKKYWAYLLTAFVLAFVGAILNILTPNKLSSLTDELTKGLMPKTEVISDLAMQIAGDDISLNALQEKIIDIIDLQITPSDIASLLNNDQVSQKDKEVLASFNINNPEQFFQSFNELSENTKLLLLNDSSYEGIKITKEEKLALLDFENGALPEKLVPLFLSEITYDGVKISISDQVSFLKIMGSIKEEKEESAMLSKLDELPKSIYELVKPQIDMSAVIKITITIAIYIGVAALFTFIEGLIMVSVAIKYAQKVREAISKKINRLPLKYFDNTTIGDVLSRITNDVDTISQSMNQSFSTLVTATTLFAGSTFMMFYTNWIMALTAIVASLLGFVFMFIILGKSQKYFTQRQRELGNINGHIEEVFSGHNVVKLYNGKDEADKKFDELNEKVYNAERKSQFLSGLMHPIMSFVGNFGYVAVCIAGAILTMNGTISFGVIVAFMIYIRMFTNPLTQLAQAASSMQSAAAASERVFEFLETEEMSDESHLTKKLKPAEVKGKVDFENVNFGYNDDRLIIKDFTAHVKPGQKIAIVGPTGAGKTTLVNLLMKFYEINSGDIKIDGISINELTRDNIHKLFIMVLQDTWLFNGTIKENIIYNKDNVSDEKINEVCKTVGIKHYIKTLPKGIESNISDANNISSGQKQLLTIARGMIEDAPFLILDEATSNVDTRTEELVQKAMDKLTEGRTSFIIAHRLSTIKNADLILVMKDGNIIEQGSHNELMKQNGFYADLYNSQFQL